MVSKKYYIIVFLLLLPGLFLYAQKPETLKSKIKLDTTYNHGADVYALAQAGDYVAFGDENGEISLIDKAGKIIKTPVKHSGWINTICYNSANKTLVSGGSDGRLTILDVTKNIIVKTIQLTSESIIKIEFVSDSLLLAASDKLYLVSVEKGISIKSFTDTKRITSFVVDNEKKSAYLGLEDGKISVFDLVKFKSVRQITNHKKKVSAFTISEDGKYLVSGDASGTFVVWELKGFKVVKSIKAHSDEISSISFSNDNKYIVTAGWDKNIYMWNRNNYKIDLNINAHKNIVTSILFNKKQLFTASFDNNIKVWSNF